MAKKFFILFVLAELITFGFITLLQFFAFPLFVVFLVCMHVGIALFIVSKKLFKKKCGINPTRFYINEYIILAFYLVVMAYKLLAKTGWYEVNNTLKLIYVLCLTAVALVVTVVNDIKCYKFINNK